MAQMRLVKTELSPRDKLQFLIQEKIKFLLDRQPEDKMITEMILEAHTFDMIFIIEDYIKELDKKA